MIEIEISVKKYLPTAYLNGHINITIFYSGFFASQIYKMKMTLESAYEK
jgi:hypothetical protein